ncbi:MAG: HD domain-containing protein [Acidimicrobiia bacterium]|nr:HD domain-containing protein [Acidimicrobiia bacterium]
MLRSHGPWAIRLICAPGATAPGRLADEELYDRDGVSEEPRRAAEQLVVLAASIGDHDRRTRGHSERVRLFAELIGEELGLADDEQAKLQWAGLIHDIGKVTVPTEILNKKAAPDAREWRILHQHPEAGAELVKATEPWLGEWVQAVESHHERWDGTGYPHGLAGAEIPRAASIIAVADSFEVMTAVRSYKAAMSLEDARVELTRCVGSHFDPAVARALLNVSIPRLRRSMGVLAALAHVPFFGRVSTAAAYAPDAVSTAVGATTTAASAGAGAMAVSAAIVVGVPGAMPVAGSDVAGIEIESAHHDDPFDRRDDAQPVDEPVVTAPPAADGDLSAVPEAPLLDSGEVAVTAEPPAGGPEEPETPSRPIAAPSSVPAPQPQPSRPAAPSAGAPVDPPHPTAAPPTDGGPGIGHIVSEMAKDQGPGGIGGVVSGLARNNGS